MDKAKAKDKADKLKQKEQDKQKQLLQASYDREEFKRGKGEGYADGYSIAYRKGYVEGMYSRIKKQALLTKMDKKA